LPFLAVSCRISRRLPLSRAGKSEYAGDGEGEQKGQAMIRRSRAGSPNRSGPGLLRTVGQTAVIAGTATVVANTVDSKMSSSAQKRAAAQQSVAAEPLAQAEPATAAPQPEPAPASDENERAPLAIKIERERIELLQQLAALKSQGILTDEEFAAEKARILGA
jgi:hypothetical protein